MSQFVKLFQLMGSELTSENINDIIDSGYRVVMITATDHYIVIVFEKPTDG